MWNAAQHKLSDYSYGTVIRSAISMRTSTYAGSAFIDAVSEDFSAYVGKKIRLVDSLGAIAIGWIKSVGSGEALGSELVGGYGADDQASYWTNISLGLPANDTSGDSYDGHSLACKFGNAAGNDGMYQRLYSSGASGRLLKYDIYGFGYYVSTGWLALMSTAICPTSAGQCFLTISQGAWAQHTGYIGVNSAAAYFVITQGDSKVLYDNISIKQVTQPSASGLRIVSTSGGTTYNWTSNTGIQVGTGTYSVTIYL
jgi:hypothetical protein